MSHPWPPCPDCGAPVVKWYLDCPCGADSDTTCNPCNLTPAFNGWAHTAHQQLDLFEAMGVTA